MRKLIAIGVALVFTGVTPAVADAAPSTSGARKAVINKLARQGIGAGHFNRYVNCERTGRSRFYCEWNGLSDSDVREGNVEGTDGTASVTYYGGRYVARTYVY